MEETTGSGERVCWVTLLDKLRIMQGDIDSIYDPPYIIGLHQLSARKKILEARQMCAAHTVPCVRVLRRSWDFMVI
jgi:hypothetical protein